MISKIKINNFKSVQENTLNLGRFNVFIGENDCGKSNILEAICFASATDQRTIKNSTLLAKGVRIVDNEITKSVFEPGAGIEFSVEIQDEYSRVIQYLFRNDENPFSSWTVENKSNNLTEEIYSKDFIKDFENYLFKNSSMPKKFYVFNYGAKMDIDEERFAGVKNTFAPLVKAKKRWTANEKESLVKQIIKFMHNSRAGLKFDQLDDFAIFSPENSFLRIFDSEEANNALGIKGQGIFKLVQSFYTSEDKSKFIELKELMKLIDWLGDIEVPNDLFATEARLTIKDRFIADGLVSFDQRSSNEGFLFLLFYFSLFLSKDTPSFFAIDNIDASLNPKLCSKLINKLVPLSKKYGKQVILTTHNPAILDGLSLDDDEQRLFVVYRNRSGHTKTKRIYKPEPLPGQMQPLLSDLFMSGALGGLPKNF